MNSCRNIRTIETYEHLDRHVRSWIEGFIPFLAIVGEPGLGKSNAYERYGVSKLHLFCGRSSGLVIYLTVAKHPDRPIVFDDVSQLLSDCTSIDLLKQLCDSRPARRITWRTKAIDEPAQEFTCTSKVLVVLNAVQASHPDVAAVLDRFDVIRFRPSKKEVLAVMRRIAKDPADVEVIARAHVMPTLRTLKRFEQWKASPHIDEIRELYAECGVPYSVRQMMQVLETVPKGQRVAAYERLSGKPHEAAKRDWSRNWKTAAQLVAASRGTRKTH